MALDVVTLNAGSGGKDIACDLVTAREYQIVKLATGPLGTITVVDDIVGARVPVNVAQCAQLPLVLGISGGLKIEDLTSPVSSVLPASQVAGNANAPTTRTVTTGLVV